MICSLIPQSSGFLQITLPWCEIKHYRGGYFMAAIIIMLACACDGGQKLVMIAILIHFLASFFAS